MVFWILLFLLLAGSIVVTLTDKNKKDDFKYFALYSNTAGWKTILFTNLSTIIGGGVTIGMISMAYKAGFAGMFPALAYAFGFLILAFMAKKIRIKAKENDAITMNQMYGDFFCGREKDRLFFRKIIAVLNLVIFFALLAVQFVGAASILKNFLGLNYELALFISVAVTIFYTAFGGVAGVYRTDKLQFVFILVMTIVLLFFTLRNPGPRAILDNIFSLDPKMIYGTKFGLVFIIGSLLFLWVSVLVRADMWQRIVSAKDDKNASKAFILTAIVIPVFYFAYIWAGLYAFNASPGLKPEDATAYLLLNTFPHWAKDVFVIGIIAALISSADSFLNISALTVTNDLLGGKNKNVNATVNATYIAGFLAFGIAFFYPKIVELFVLGTALNTILIPALLTMLFFKKKYFISNFIVLALGLILNILFFIGATLKLIKISPEAAFIPAFVITMVVFIISVIFENILKNEK